MKTKITPALKWLKTVVLMSFLALLFSTQLFAQNHHHPRFHQWNDSIPGWADSIHVWIGRDSGHTWHDSGLVPPPHDSGFTWNDSGHFHFPPPPPPGDSGHTWHDSGFTPPPPPPGDSGHIWNDSNHLPPPPPPPGDSGHIWNDSNHLPPPPPPHGDSTGCGGSGPHRMADPNSASAVNIMIYPNPVFESAVIHIANTSGNVTFIMYDASGRLAMVKSFTNGDFQLDKGNMGAGLYYYEIIDGSTNVSKGKLIFQ